MDALLNKGIKEIIDIHNLPEDQEQELMQKIAGTIYPGQDQKIPPRKSASFFLNLTR